MSTRDITILVLLAVVVVAAALAVVAVWRNGQIKRRRELHLRFGPEYERLLAEYDDPRRADRELEARAQRVHKLHIKELTEGERKTFAEAWRQTQARFVDTPSIAVRAAHDLVQQVMRQRGYPVDDFEQGVADLSVDHATVVEHYRAAHALQDANRQGREDTEELRQAMVHYRALFSDLLGMSREPRPSSRRLTTAHA